MFRRWFLAAAQAAIFASLAGPAMPMPSEFDLPLAEPADVSNPGGGAEVATSDAATGSADRPGPADRLLEALDPPLRSLISEALIRNPRLTALAAEVRAATVSVPQSKALPNPTVEVTAWALPPETRVGPQRFTAMFEQMIPARGKRGASEEASLQRSIAALEMWQAERLRLVTKLRTTAHELAFLEAHQTILDHLRGHLVQHEDIARERYATGAGIAQSVIRIQADITEIDHHLLGLELRRVQLSESINQWRDRPPETLLPKFTLKVDEVDDLDLDGLLKRAHELRPERAAADAEIERAEALIVLAEKVGNPDWTFGATYTLVDQRSDPAGIAMPPQDNGADIFGLRARMTLPVRKTSNQSKRDEAQALQLAAISHRSVIEAEIRSMVADRALRLPLLWRQLRLLEDVLVVQAEESLNSARSAYVTGRLDALGLLHAEHVLFDARISAARAQADHQIAVAELEGAVGESLPRTHKEVPE